MTSADHPMNKPELEALLERQATVSRLPWNDGDGYSYGGQVVLTIGGRSMLFGNSNDDKGFADEIAKRWNAALISTSEAEE